MHPHLTTATGKTRLLNTKTEHVDRVFYGTVTNDINLGGSFLFSNNTFLNTTHSNAVYTCPGCTCTTSYRTGPSDITIQHQVADNLVQNLQTNIIHEYTASLLRVSITSSLFESVSSTGDVGVILAELGPESKLPD
ncbi:hypothetical protein BLNAU_23470 [Blattamonas nauphoetae]|uniref:Uncharacterized protein n=1 Tax=Blattamonas nauphoetae TaxID=2049346 RepID=A0ABQ9WQ50_9EUKA|nr:hypothetical protein BLNAU_23470 [Blattamonas nauphoetae]